MAEAPAETKASTGVKKTSSFKAESETQTAVAVRVPSIKKPPQPKSQESTDTMVTAEKLVTAEQAQNAAVARRRRLMARNRAQGARTRDKTPESYRPPLTMPDDTTTTDEEEVRLPKTPLKIPQGQKNLQGPKSPSTPTTPNTPPSPTSSNQNVEEVEEDDSYAVMKKKLEEKMTKEKDPDDLDIDAIREAQAEEARERRRRSISPFALPTAEEIERLQRKGSFVDPGNKMLTAIPNYGLCLKDDTDPGSRKNSLILSEADEIAAALENIIDPNTQAKQHQLITPPPSPRQPQQTSLLAHRPKLVEKTAQPTPTTKQTNQIQPKPKSCIKTPTNASDPHPPLSSGTKSEPEDVPPIRPKRSKSGTRSQGRTSESEMSEDQSRHKVEQQPQKVPKPKERRKTIATAKRQILDRSPMAKRSRSATRPESSLDNTGIELTKTSSEIIGLLQKARNSSVSIPDVDERISSAVKAYVDRSREMMTPTRFPSSRRGSGITCPKTIEIISGKEIIDSFKQAQRRSMEMERSRRSSGYIDASQSEMTSSCYSSSYSEDDSDFDLSKKAAELNRKLALLHFDKPPSGDESNGELLMDEPKIVEKPKVEVKTKTISKPITMNDIKTTDYKWMRQNCRRMWREFKSEHPEECQRIRLLWNRCFSDLIILIIFCGFGGVMFRYTEGAFENFYKCGVRRVKRDFIDTLWQGSHNLKEEDWKSMARKKLWEFETQLHTANEAGVHSYSGQKAWSFLNSVVYCLTVVTTIGYGHIAPSTRAGRAITIVYAIIGIPIFLILLADFGKLLTRCIKFLWAFVRRLYYTGSCRKVRKTVPVQEVMKGLNIVYEAASTLRRPSQFHLGDEVDPEVPPKLPKKPISKNNLAVPERQTSIEEPEEIPPSQTPALSVFEIDDQFNLPISVAIVILIIYIFMGASIYMVWEDWGFFESFYFVFISMSTIGFGDFVPNHPMYMMGSIIYLLFGMALTSMCINVVQEKLSDSFRQASAKIGATIGLKVAEEDGSLAPVTPAAIEMPGVHGSSSKTNEDTSKEIKDK